MSWLVSSIITAVLDWVTRLISKRMKDKESEKQIEEQAKADTDKLNKADSETSREQATDDIADHTF